MKRALRIVAVAVLVAPLLALFGVVSMQWEAGQSLAPSLAGIGLSGQVDLAWKVAACALLVGWRIDALRRRKPGL